MFSNLMSASPGCENVILSKAAKISEDEQWMPKDPSINKKTNAPFIPPGTCGTTYLSAEMYDSMALVSRTVFFLGTQQQPAIPQQQQPAFIPIPQRQQPAFIPIPQQLSNSSFTSQLSMCSLSSSVSNKRLY